MEGMNDHDQVMLLLYDDKAGYENMKLTGQFRYTGSDELQLPAPAGEFHVYVAFIAHDRSRQSHSVYLGKLQS
jgi:hypothetical protein